MQKAKCWGYERNCTAGQRHGLPTSGCLNDRFLQEFWNSVDFGYVQERREEFDKLLLCRPGAQQQSMLQCSKYTRYCKAQNLFIDFTGLRDPHNRDKFRENVFKQGQIGGDCVLDRQLLQAQGDHKSPLQSWYAELENFSSMKFARDKCDVTIEHPVIFMKMDWGGNMFHHFCDFFNLYVTLHVNGSYFDRNSQIVMWDTVKTPKIRVTLLQRGTPENEKIFRQIKNQKDLEKVFDDFPDLELKVVEYDWRKMSFKEQLSVTHNSDIFIGMHGAGLTHFLFLPPWAVAFELYNCDDKDCYYDLARLRGVKYVTWSDGGNPVNTPKPSEQGKHHKYGQNPKFWNWRFEPQRFKEILSEAREYVLNHATYKSLISKKLSKQ
uniref:EGF domain-specific O-linked N-acetylglucosamine transferase n=1 Tax=Ciona savignyi TaxID=51511 RepID=H2ZP70_CIOSA